MSRNTSPHFLHYALHVLVELSIYGSMHKKKPDLNLSDLLGLLNSLGQATFKPHFGLTFVSK